MDSAIHHCVIVKMSTLALLGNSAVYFINFHLSDYAPILFILLYIIDIEVFTELFYIANIKSVTIQ